jgi:uncharacterized protein YjbI with pentapeptide repeats
MTERVLNNSEEQNKRLDQIKELVDQFEVRLYEQEHRIGSAIKNFIFIRPTLPQGDKRRRAIEFSVIWALFFSPGGVAALGSVAAFSTILLLAWQNTLMRESNQLLLTQIQSEERVALQSQRLGAIRDLYGDEPAALRSEALLTLTTITERLYELAPQSTHLVRRDLRGANLKDCVLDYKEVANFDFSNASFVDATIAAGVFKYCSFNQAQLNGTRLESAFQNCRFDQVDFSGVITDGAIFENCQFVDVDFSTYNPVGAKFRGCYFKNCIIPPSSPFFKNADLDASCELNQIATLGSQDKEQLKARTNAKITEDEYWK